MRPRGERVDFAALGGWGCRGRRAASGESGRGIGAMGRMKKVDGMAGVAGAGVVPLPAALTDFRQESYWDQFFKASQGRPFEWYGDWASLPSVFRELLGLNPDRQPPLEILVPGCGNSRLSAAMYDAGFVKIINVDFNKRVVAEMLRLNVRARPLMRWQVMDITKMQVFTLYCLKP